MNKSEQEERRMSSGLLGASGLMDRLHYVRKRKQSFGGQAVDVEALKQRLVAERRRKRGR